MKERLSIGKQIKEGLNDHRDAVQDLENDRRREYLNQTKTFIEKRLWREAGSSLDLLHYDDLKEVAQFLVKKEELFFLQNHLRAFWGILDKKSAQTLIENGHAVFVGGNLELFTGLDQDILKALVAAGVGGDDDSSLRYDLDRFGPIDDNTAKFLVSHGRFYSNEISTRSGISVQERVDLAIKYDKGYHIFYEILLHPKDNVYGNLESLTGTEALRLIISNRKIDAFRSIMDSRDGALWNKGFAQAIIDTTPYVSNFVQELKHLGVWNDILLDSYETFSDVLDMATDPAKNLSLFRAHTGLARAFVENSRDSIRLLRTLPDLDRLSQENIIELYTIKSRSSVHSAIETLEYRRFAQKELLQYRKNKKIQEHLIDSGVDVEQWLNYERVDDFTLGVEQDAAFTKMVETPMMRLQETFDIYNNVFKEALGQYKKELIEHKVSLEDESMARTQVAAMQKALEQARVEGDEKKIQGIERGIAGMRNRLENPKMVSLWDKLVGDYDIVMRLQKDLIEVNAKIRQAEDGERMASAAELTTPERRTQIQAAKAQREHLEASFRDKLEKMDARFTAFQEKLPQMLASGISEERAEALVQEVQMSTSEQIGHYQSDISTLKDILSDDEEKENLEGRSMSIELWNRDPDVDLYLGNYTSCCVSIDNDVHGSESPISDYLTDIGIQVITITDQKRKRPIAAAWCYVGIDKGKNIALVIDNVEADTKYSVPFQSQLENKLHEYIQAYADAAGIKIVSQGPANNDLVVANLEEKYMKLGGYNRPSGYFLEAEPDDDGGEYGDEQ